jgi:hypothetical protein
MNRIGGKSNSGRWRRSKTFPKELNGDSKIVRLSKWPL